MYQGLVDCNSEDEFDEKLVGWKETWDARETRCSRLSNKDRLSFYEWFRKEKVNKIYAWRELLISPSYVYQGKCEHTGLESCVIYIVLVYMSYLYFP